MMDGDNDGSSRLEFLLETKSGKIGLSAWV